MSTISTKTTVSRACPEDSMKSTWRFADKSTWSWYHWSIELMNGYHWDPNIPTPIHQKTDSVSSLASWSVHAWVLIHVAIALAIHQTWVSLTGVSMGALAAVFYYSFFYTLTAVHEIQILRRLGHRYGFFDGDIHERDAIPDVGVKKVALAAPKTIGGRMGMAAWLTYYASETPLDVMSHWQWWAWLLLQIGLYGIILDFWFYWYHRAMHSVGGLWKFHRKHHLTKHPSPLLGAYADEAQEFFDMVGIPFLTWCTFHAVGIPLGFYDWFICHQYVTFTEIMGHSGIRLHAIAPSTMGWLLEYFNMDLAIEDHDLHHRKGWRQSYNYGKQTRVWDRLFGTCHARIETTAANLDYEEPAILPLL